MNKKINKILNNGSSSPDDLMSIANALKIKLNFIGSMYVLPKLKIGKYIALITPNSSINAGHWVCIKVEKDKVFYFDSFGIPPPTSISKKTNLPIYYNDRQIQDIDTNFCGQYCLYFLKYGIIDNFIQLN